MIYNDDQAVTKTDHHQMLIFRTNRAINTGVHIILFWIVWEINFLFLCKFSLYLD